MLHEVEDHKKAYERKQALMVQYLLTKQDEQDQLIKQLKHQLL